MNQTDVAIIGAGPVGLTLANLLGVRGLSVRIIEKKPEPYDLPRAIHFDGEAMRVFQATGLAEEVLAHTHVGVGMLFKNADDEVLIDWSRAQEIGPMGWHESYRFHPGLEDALRRGLDRFPHVELTSGVAVADLNSATGDLTLEGGDRLSANFVVGCDGADSFTRRAAGLPLKDLGFQERWLVADARLKRPRPDLGDYSIQFCDAENPATYVRGTKDRRRWEIRMDQTKGDPDDQAIWSLLSRWITPEDAELERAAVYTFRSAVVDRWREGRVLIAGDAAHQMPPFMGQGMCAGVRDVSNLAWKLDHAIRGGDDSILDSYGSERAEHVTEFIDLTMRLGKLINQTATGEAPKGQMKSIWPGLGPGLGARDEVVGRLAPQPRLANGKLADEAAKGGFYVLSRLHFDAPVPVFVDAADWLAENDLFAVLVRPDAYVLSSAPTEAEVAGMLETGVVAQIISNSERALPETEFRRCVRNLGG